MDSFVAIDVETANQNASSICSIGAVKVIDGAIVDTKYALVCPEPNWYSHFCVRVHGITAEDTDSAPTFDEVWQDFSDWIGTLPLVAHNASFDNRCINEACKVYRLNPPVEPFKCTLRAARSKIPNEMCPSKSLPVLCDFFGIPFNNHHNALADAEACAKLAIILL
jgi:DNA polymerase-3 subunit epsilon